MDAGESSSGDPRCPLWKKLWHLNIPSKMRIFAWKMCMNALPTFENLRRRGVKLYEICPACGKEPESILHALVRCDLARRVWKCWEDGHVDLLNVNMDVTDIALLIYEAGTSRDLEFFFGAACAIWYNRNKIVHEYACQVPELIWSFARSYILEFKCVSKAYSQQLTQTEENWVVPPPGVFKTEENWAVPPPGVFKINVDGATSENDRNSSMGAVIRDAFGSVLTACCKYLQGQYSVEEVEVLAVECGLILAREQKLSQIILESDALNTVNRVLAAETNGCLGHLYQGIQCLLSSFNCWKIKHVKRDYNKAAHELVKYARQREMSQAWKGVCPPMIVHVVQADCG